MEGSFYEFRHPGQRKLCSGTPDVWIMMNKLILLSVYLPTTFGMLNDIASAFIALNE